jgi:hypothetical protein
VKRVARGAGRQEPEHRVRRRGLRDRRRQRPARPSSCTPGQVCSAGARLIVEASIADELVAELATRAEAIRIGNGLDPPARPAAGLRAHRAKIEDFVASAREEGAGCSRAGAAPTTRSWPRATSTGPPCSTAATGACGWCARRRSARC